MTSLSFLLAVFLAPSADTIAAAKRDAHGILVHAVESSFQDSATEIRVLLPDRIEKDKRYPVVYLLPVEPGNGTRWGDGLLLAKQLDLHNRHGVILVYPTFSRWPWYGDHPTNDRLRQETYFLKAVLPFVEKQYPARAEPNGRLLVGFSKSGNGALLLLLRHPDVFGRAAAFDAPLTLKGNGYGSFEVFSTQEHFEKHYWLEKLAEQRAELLRKEKRLALIGHGSFRKAHQDFHEKLDALKIPHEYVDGPARKHAWEASWLNDALRFVAPDQ